MYQAQDRVKFTADGVDGFGRNLFNKDQRGTVIKEEGRAVLVKTPSGKVVNVSPNALEKTKGVSKVPAHVLDHQLIFPATLR